jgi:hypothetical protein
MHRLLDEIEKVAEFILKSNLLGSPTTYEKCSITRETDILAISSFPHLAVKLQLESYVKKIARRLYNDGEKDLLSTLFQVASTEYVVCFRGVMYDSPNLQMIEDFLELGVSPNWRF